jgi:phosphoglycolate phosphatase
MALPFDSVVFDLDGTLWDPCPTCAFAWNKVLRLNRIGFRPITAEDVRAVAGKPHEACVRETFQGLPEDALRLLISATMAGDIRVIREKGADLYPGVLAGLANSRGFVPCLS